MIVSGTWWKRVEARLRPVAVAPLLLLLSGCGLENLLFSPTPSQAPLPPLPPVQPNASRTEVSSGLSPLLTPQQVLTAVPFGRSDPFAALPKPAAAAASATATAEASAGRSPGSAAPSGGATGAGGGAPARGSSASGGSSGSAATALATRLGPPEGFQLTGVIRSGGRAEALVSYGTLSGSLRLGDRGGRSTALLPPGWALAAIQFGGSSPSDPPSITLRRGSRSVRVSL